MLGTVNPVELITRRAHEVGALVVVDASQAVPQFPVDLAALDADFVAFTRSQALRADRHRRALRTDRTLAQLPPFLGGAGDDRDRPDGGLDLTPARRTASSRHPTDRAGDRVGRGNRLPVAVGHGRGRRARAGDHRVTLWTPSKTVAGLRILGPDVPVDRGGAISFTLGDLHPHDIGQVSTPGRIAVRAVTTARAGTRPLRRGGIHRASFYLYTTPAEIDALIEGLEYVKRYFEVG